MDRLNPGVADYPTPLRSRIYNCGQYETKYPTRRSHQTKDVNSPCERGQNPRNFNVKRKRGTREQVFNGEAELTRGGLRQQDLKCYVDPRAEKLLYPVRVRVADPNRIEELDPAEPTSLMARGTNRDRRDFALERFRKQVLYDGYPVVNLDMYDDGD